MKDTEFYTSRRLNEPYVSNLMDQSLQKYVLDPQLRKQPYHTQEDELLPS